MKRSVRLLCTFSVVCLFGCEEDRGPLNWPSFDPEVIEAGRASVIHAGRPGSVRERPGARKDRQVDPPPTPKEVPPTREAVLKKLRIACDPYGRHWSAATGTIRALGKRAIEPLLEIVRDDAIPARYADSAVSLLIQAARRKSDEGQPGTGSSRPTGRVFDAVVDYLRRRPATRARLSGLSSVTPRDRLPRIVELIESSSDQTRATLIGVFCRLTHTSFPAMSRGPSCGNSTAASVESMKREGLKRQQESVQAIKKWWAEHGDEPYQTWVNAAFRRIIDKETESRERRFANGDPLYDGSLDDPEVRNRDIRQYNFAVLPGIRSELYGRLVDEFEEARWFVKPWILTLIGGTGHPDAIAFVAERLHSDDPNLQHAAITVLRGRGVAAYLPEIGQILRTTPDDHLAYEAVDALRKLANPEAIGDCVAVLNHKYRLVRSIAISALRPFLVSHADRLRQLAEAQQDPMIAETLHPLVTRAQTALALHAALSSDGDLGPILGRVRELLRSPEPKSQQQGISLVVRYELAELVPLVVELVRASDIEVRRWAVGAVLELGVPGLTIKSARRLLGYSLELDRCMAAYCYAKFGRDALPLVKKVALRWEDPIALDARNSAPPAVGLLLVLLEEEVPGIEKGIVRMIKSVPRPWRHIGLLALLDDSKSAKLVGDYLHAEDTNRRRRALRVVRARKLTRHADTLATIASVVPVEQDFGALRDDYAAGRLLREDFDQRRREVSDGPGLQFMATMGLIEMGDARAWKAAVRCLGGRHLDWRNRSMVGPGIVTEFGGALSSLKAAHSSDMHALLRSELDGAKRSRILVAVTTALAIEPSANDVDTLWMIASSSEAPVRARGLAAIALSKLGEKRVLRVLHNLIRPQLHSRADVTRHANFEPEFGAVRMANDRERVRDRRRSLLSSQVPRAFDRPILEFHHIDLGLALRRLGDRSLVAEVVESLSDERGEFNVQAFRLLAGIVGVEALDTARTWCKSRGVDPTKRLSSLAATLCDHAVDPAAVLPSLAPDGETALSQLRLIVRLDLGEAADAIVRAYEELDDTPRWHREAKVLDALCRLGDLRGIELATKDAMLMAAVGKFLPDAPVVDFAAGRFKYNRVEDAIPVQDWCAAHVTDLRWDPDSSVFRLERRTP